MIIIFSFTYASCHGHDCIKLNLTIIQS
jgi:hypothetical protein